MSVELTKENYASAIASGASKPMLVDFWGPKCTHCLALMPSVDALEEKYAGKFTLGKVNVASAGNRRVAMSCKVMSLPTVLFYKGGAEVARLVGPAASPDAVEDELKRLIG